MNQPLFAEQDNGLIVPITGDRDPLDRYYTPRPVVRPLTCTLGRRLRGCHVWEPCSGGGAIVRELHPWVAGVFASDIDPGAPYADVVELDFLEVESIAELGLDHPIDWIITNPPYKNVDAYIRHALTLCRRVALLVRLTVLETTKGRRFLANEQLTDLLEVGRVAFEGPAGELVRQGKQSSDMVPHIWMVWDAEAPHEHTQILHFPDITKERS